MFSSDYVVSTQLKFWLFYCWHCGCCCAVTKLRLLLYWEKFKQSENGQRLSLNEYVVDLHS